MTFWFIDEYVEDASQNVEHIARHIVNASTFERAEKKFNAIKRVISDDDDRMVKRGDGVYLSQWSEID